MGHNAPVRRGSPQLLAIGCLLVAGSVFAGCGQRAVPAGPAPARYDGPLWVAPADGIPLYEDPGAAGRVVDCRFEPIGATNRSPYNTGAVGDSPDDALRVAVKESQATAWSMTSWWRRTSRGGACTCISERAGTTRRRSSARARRPKAPESTRTGGEDVSASGPELPGGDLPRGPGGQRHRSRRAVRHRRVPQSDCRSPWMGGLDRRRRPAPIDPCHQLPRRRGLPGRCPAPGDGRRQTTRSVNSIRGQREAPRRLRRRAVPSPRATTRQRGGISLPPRVRASLVLPGPSARLRRRRPAECRSLATNHASTRLRLSSRQRVERIRLNSR